MGRRGRIRVKGGLPLTADSSPATDAVLLSTAASVDAEAKAAGKEPARAGLLVDVHGLEMRVRNVYTGRLPHLCSLLMSSNPADTSRHHRCAFTKCAVCRIT